MKKILAVSGGIDSVVLLHLFCADPSVIVAHFDHGIRPSSADDCAFVARLATSYHLPFVSRRAHLGQNCSEAAARTARYRFLRSIAARTQGEIYTAHHADDLLESIAINCLRGTGWRGLVPLRDPSLQRPLLNWAKSDIYHYAAKHQLIFRLDPTNNDSRYLRNRIRIRLQTSDFRATKAQLRALYDRQAVLAQIIDQLLSKLIGDQKRLSRPFFRALDDNLAIEVLYFYLKIAKISLTRPQLHRALAAIRTYAPSTRFSLSKTHFLRFGRQLFWLEASTVHLC